LALATVAGAFVLAVGVAGAAGSLLQPYQAYAVGSWPAAVTIADVTGDGRSDVVMTTHFYFDPANDYRLWVFAQQSDGSLAAPVSYATAAAYNNGPYSVAAGDLTGDGRKDVVVGLNGLGVQVFPQLASGELGAPNLFPTADGRLVRLGHLDDDPYLDVAAAGWGTNTVSVLRGNGAGGLQPPVQYAAQHAGYDDLEVGDVTGDGRDDIVVMSGQVYAVPNVSVLAQLPAGGFGAVAEYRVAPNVNTQGIALGDVTGDGRKDVVASYGGNRPSSYVAVFAQTAAGTLAAPLSYPSYDIPEPVETADVDLDGRQDVVTLHGGWLDAGLYRQAAGGTLAAEELYPLPYASHYEPHGLAVGDLDGNGSPDVALADYNNGLVVLRNSLAGTPPPPPSADVGVDIAPSAPRAQPKKGFAFDAAVTNAGPSAAGATLTVDVAGVATSATVDDARCSVQLLRVTCSFTNLAANSSSTVRVSGSVRGKGTVTATAKVHATVSDPNQLNDNDSASIQVR
jgi:FG-GAP-like repeat/Domain of unknown function DUF11